MKAIGVIIGCVAIAICFSSCTKPVVELDLSSGEPSLGQPAILEWIWTPNNWRPIDLVQVDGRSVALKKTMKEGGIWIRNLLKLSPGKHRLLFRGENNFPLYPDVVEFEAEAGKRYTAEFEDVNFKETDGKVTTLYFNFASPVVFEVRNGTPVKVATGAPVLFKPLFDAEKNFLLYEEATLPKEQTARIYFPRQGLPKHASVFIKNISGRAGEIQVEYLRSLSDPWQLRLLPGEYHFGLTMEGGGVAVGIYGVRSQIDQAEGRGRAHVPNQPEYRASRNAVLRGCDRTPPDADPVQLGSGV